MGSAVFSPCERYRYVLRRTDLDLTGRGIFAVIGINPSTATASKDDPTIRRCIGFARNLGYRELLMLNLFAWRSTDPKELLKQADPVGPANNEMLRVHGAEAAIVVAAWGAKSGPLGRLVQRRARIVAERIGRPLHALRLTADGSPEHPLFLPAGLKPVPYQVPRG